MIDWSFTFLIAGAGYGINILVLGIISMVLWILSKVIEKMEKKG